MASEGTYTFHSLPPEIWIEILKLDILDERDICNVSQVCRRLNEIASSNDVWKAKTFQRWPKQTGLPAESNWRAVYKIRRQVLRTLDQYVHEVAEENYFEDYVSDDNFDKFVKLSEVHEKGWHFILEDLFAILDSHRHVRLTDKFYTRKIVKYLQHHRLRQQWAAFFDRPQEQQYLETGATLVSAWMQALEKDTSRLDVTAELDSMANKVRDLLRSRSSGPAVHPACSKDNSISGITENLWSAEENRQVLKAVNKVLYEDVCLKGCQTNHFAYYAKKNSFIDVVLQQKEGIPITMSIIYHAVCLRLGVVCEPVNFPNHFVLAFRDKALSGKGDDMLYIDAFNQGKITGAYDTILSLLPGHVPHDINQAYFETVKPHIVFERMARNLVCLFSASTSAEETLPVFHDAVSLFLAITPNDPQMTMVYTNLCLHLNINLHDAITKLRSSAMGLIGGAVNLIARCEKQIRVNPRRRAPNFVKIRSQHPEVELSIGMVMKHKRYDYFCVIYGWDQECKASRQWIHQMGVPNLPKGQHQPFYNVLVADGTIRYAAQENLLYTREVQEITHSAVGRHFQEFTGRYYLPNSSKQLEYPDDAEVTRTLMDKFFSSGDQ